MTFGCWSLAFVGLTLGATAVAPVSKIENNDGVLHLIGEPDFRDVSLRWEFEQAPAPPAGPGSAEGTPPPPLYGFQIHYCEIQAWGAHRCRTKVIDNTDESANQVGGAGGGARRGRGGRQYGARIAGLRMATTYSFEVRPVERDARDLDDAQSIGKSIIVPTKGFSARATQCLPHASEVEVSTGPHFGGRIAVEAADGGPERCGLQGNPSSAQDAYILRIHHAECGSEVNDTTVATYVIVQENLPILTHSTRRFLVLCTYQPETLTVRAGINLPSSSSGERPRSPQPGAVEHYDGELDNEVRPAPLQASDVQTDDSMFGEIALVVFLVMACFAGIALLVWKLAPRAGGDDVSIGTASSASSAHGSGFLGRLARRNMDRFSDGGSVYSITLSERDECGPRKPHADGDNTSEA